MALASFASCGYGTESSGPARVCERDRPVVVAPVEHVVVAGLLQQVGRDVALGDPRTEPAARRLAFVPRDLGGRLCDQLALFCLGQLSLPFRIGAAMRGDLAAGGAERRDQLGTDAVDASS